MHTLMQLQASTVAFLSSHVLKDCGRYLRFGKDFMHTLLLSLWLWFETDLPGPVVLRPQEWLL